MFPGQGAQFPGMGKNLYEQSSVAKEYFEQANEILGFRITDVMFSGTEADLKQTNVTQPSVFLHSVILFETTPGLKPDMVAGHSLGELSALVANKCLTFEDGLRIVARRAAAMQRACELAPSAMSAVLGLTDEQVVALCAEAAKETGEVVIAANFNQPGQVVISGTVEGIRVASEKMKAAGAKRCLSLTVGGAFHSPLMAPAREELAEVINSTTFHSPVCPVYHNVNTMPSTDAATIRQNLIDQLTAPVLWTQSVLHMVADGATHFTECGPGKVLQGLVRKIAPEAVADAVDHPTE